MSTPIPAGHPDHPTDEQLLAAIQRGVWDGSLVEVTPEWLAEQRAALAAELEAEAKRHIRRAARHDITLARSDFEVIDGELFLDGMAPDEWIDAMTMD